ncbi:MAG TPA: hypothetical protein VF486_02650 [Actinomycetes bacterium]
MATILAVYKPRGMTRYGQRKQRRELARKRVAPEGGLSPVGPVVCRREILLGPFTPTGDVDYYDPAGGGHR